MFIKSAKPRGAFSLEGPIEKIHEPHGVKS